MVLRTGRGGVHSLLSPIVKIFSHEADKERPIEKEQNIFFRAGIEAFLQQHLFKLFFQLYSIDNRGRRKIWSNYLEEMFFSTLPFFSDVARWPRSTFTEGATSWRMPRPLWTPLGKKAKRHRLPKNKRAVQIASRLSLAAFESSFHPFPDFSPPFRSAQFDVTSCFFDFPFSIIFLSRSIIIPISEQHANKRVKGLHGGKSRERETRVTV